MVDYQTISVIFTGVSISLAAFYYISTLRNVQRNQKQQLETRQTQLFMNLYETWRSPHFREAINKLRGRKWKDLEEWESKYGPEENPDEATITQTVFTFYDGLGVLVRRGLIDIGIIDELMYVSFVRAWETYEPVFRQVRERDDNPLMYRNSEYLYDEITKHRKNNPILK